MCVRHYIGIMYTIMHLKYIYQALLSLSLTLQLEDSLLFPKYHVKRVYNRKLHVMNLCIGILWRLKVCYML